MRFTAIILALLLSAPTMAHQLKASVTTVLFNKRTNNIELMHRFYLHDTEHAVEHLFDGNADILSNKEDQKRFMKKPHGSPVSRQSHSLLNLIAFDFFGQNDPYAQEVLLLLDLSWLTKPCHAIAGFTTPAAATKDETIVFCLSKEWVFTTG